MSNICHIRPSVVKQFFKILYINLSFKVTSNTFSKSYHMNEMQIF